MESVMLTIKFAVMYGLVVFVVAVVGATVIGVLYRLIRGQVQSAPGQVDESHAPAPATVQKD